MPRRQNTHGDPLLDRIVRTCDTHSLLLAGERVLVAVSGGPDSVALAHALLRLRSQFEISIAVAHLNHRLRGTASEHDAAFVRQLAKRWQIACHCAGKDVRGYSKQQQLSLEDAGRRLRYRFLRQTAQAHGYQKIALGHHRDDNAEQVLMNLMRGTGIQGLSGIYPLRQENLIRPLIDADREEILAYLNRNGIDYVEDASNRDRHHVRNRVRHDLLPLLSRDYNPNIRDSLNRLVEIAREENSWLQLQTEIAFSRVCQRRSKRQIVLAVSELCHQHVALQRRLVRYAIRLLLGSEHRIGYGHVASALALVERPDGPKRLDLPHRIQITVTGAEMILRREQHPLRQLDRPAATAPSAVYHYTLSAPGRVQIAEIGQNIMLEIITRDQLPSRWKSNHRVAYMDLERIQFPVVIRSPRPEDRFRPLGMMGSQSVQAFFKRQKISHRIRCATPLLADPNRILWVAGCRIHEAVKIQDKTRRILKGQLMLA